MRRGDSELCPNHLKIGHPTPVPTVAMDCGPLESRLDRLDTLGRSGLGAMVRTRRSERRGSIEREDMMAQTFIGRKRVRKFFGKIEEVAEMPNLIEVQKASYDQFLLVKEPEVAADGSDPMDRLSERI